MPDIDSAIEFPDDLQSLIDKKTHSEGFSYKNWNEDDLEILRNFIRRYYRSQQYGKCAYCKKEVSLVSALNCHVEHIAPKSLYPKFIFEPRNLCVICADCNQIKREQETIDNIPDTVVQGGKRVLYPRSSDAFKIVHPHFDIYDDHIEVFGDFLYVDKSPKGAFTISACVLNRRLHVFGWRRELISMADVSEIMTCFLGSHDAMEQMNLLHRLSQLLILK